MSQKHVALVAGTRPNFVKIAPLIRSFSCMPERLSYRLIHTGQHFDREMNTVFFEELGIPLPDASLGCGGGTHAESTGRVMMALEAELSTHPVDSVLVVGDVNSTLAAALVAKKLHAELIHVEAGLRSGDRTMPEEINRLATDAITDLFFTTEPAANAALLREGHPAERIHLVGNVMIDNLFYQRERLKAEPRSGGRGQALRDSFEGKRYGVVTLHRPSNVDFPETFKGIAKALEVIALELPLVFPMHPRTKARCVAMGVTFSKHIQVMPPLSYMEFLALWQGADVILTDSGGVQEETTALGVRCITVRENTERPATIAEGTNLLAGTLPERIVETTRDSLAKPPSTRRPQLWDGMASERISRIVAGLDQAAMTSRQL